MLYSSPIPYAKNAGEYFAKLADLPYAAWLDSGGMERYDILVAQPIATLLTLGGQTQVTNASGQHISDADPFDLLREQIGTPIPAIPEIPFSGGALGYWGYDLSRRWLNSATKKKTVNPLPDMSIGIYDWAVVIDHLKESAHLVSRLQNDETHKVLPDILTRLQQRNSDEKKEFRVNGNISSNFTRNAYESAFDRIQKYLTAGDCYQVNLAQCFSADADGDALPAYLKIREINPAPYSAFLNLPDLQILSISPERFLRVQNNIVETRPIKGTRRRGDNAESDERLKEDLRSNKKDQAENLMIVDLLRNDLSKSCRTGTVKVSELFGIESFANVHHMVSTITGTLACGKDALSLLRDCFPGGSITGAPKKRAMEIIDELEPVTRGIYCGAIGYIGWDGQMDSNIAIRTLIFANGKIQFSVGGGIVADSSAAGEYQETLDKAKGMLELLRIYGGKL